MKTQNIPEFPHINNGTSICIQRKSSVGVAFEYFENNMKEKKMNTCVRNK